MKKILFTLVLTLGILYSANAQNYLIKASYDSEKLNTAWNNYIQNPLGENALKVYNLLPKKGQVRKEDADLNLQNKIYNNLKIVETQILYGDKNNIKLAFRLFTISDGAFSEWLQEMLGESINHNPKIFLTELKEHSHLFENFDSLVGNFSEEFADNLGKQITETKKRIESLKTIKDSELSTVKNRSLESLGKKLKALESREI